MEVEAEGGAGAEAELLGAVELVDGSLEGAVGVVALVMGAAQEAGQAGVFEDFGDGGDGGGQAVELEAVGDLVGGEVAGAELEDALVEVGTGIVGGRAGRPRCLRKSERMLRREPGE